VTGAKDAEAARLIVGTNNPSAASRPFGVAFTPDGKTLLVSNFRANNLSFVDVEKALSGGLGAEVARLPLATPDGKPSRPRGIAITPDGKYAAITGAPRGEPGAACCGSSISRKERWWAASPASETRRTSLRCCLDG
jgi:hypothetical protein